MQKKAAGKAEKAIDAVTNADATKAIKATKVAAAAKASKPVAKVTKPVVVPKAVVTTEAVTAPTATTAPSKSRVAKPVAPKTKESPRISLAALAMGTAAVPVVEEVPEIKAVVPVKPAKTAKLAAAAKPAPATKVAKPAAAAKIETSASVAKPAKKTVAAAVKSSPAASKEKPIRRVYKGIRLSPNLGPVHDSRVEVMVAPEPIMVAAATTVVPPVAPAVEPSAAPKKLLLKRQPITAPVVEVAPVVAPKKVLLKRRPTDSQAAPAPQAMPVVAKRSRMAAVWAALRFPSAWVVATWAVLAVFMGSVAYSNQHESDPATVAPLAAQASVPATPNGSTASQAPGIHHAVAYQAELTRSGVTGHYNYR
jgi:hypothetical protein